MTIKTKYYKNKYKKNCFTKYHYNNLVDTSDFEEATNKTGISVGGQALHLQLVHSLGKAGYLRPMRVGVRRGG